MSKRAMTICGAFMAVVALLSLVGYFAAVGLDRADKLASVLGVFIGLAGLVLAVIGLFPSRPARTEAGAEPKPASPPGDVRNTISGTVLGDSVQARDIHGGITFGAPRPGGKDAERD